MKHTLMALTLVSLLTLSACNMGQTAEESPSPEASPAAEETVEETTESATPAPTPEATPETKEVTEEKKVEKKEETEVKEEKEVKKEKEAKEDNKKAINVEKSSLTWEAYKVIGGHFGTIKLKSGEVTVENDMITGGTFTIDMETIKDADGSAGLEAHLKNEDFFDVANHKTATLKITSVEKNEGDDYTVTGDLTIKGKTHPITFIATMKKNGDIYFANAAKISVDRTKYDITYKSASFFSDLGDGVIKDNFDISVAIITQ